MNETPSNQESTQKPVYPETKLSDKSLEALHSVIGKPAKKSRKNNPAPGPKVSIGSDIQDIIDDVKTDTTIEPNPLPAPLPDIEIKDRTVIKTVFLVIFLVLFIAAAAVAGWYYWWTTHATFDHTLHPVVILDGQHVNPEDFLYPSAEMEEVTAIFQNPDFDPFVGMQYVQLELHLGLRSMDAAAPLFVLTAKEKIEHEYAEEGTALRAVDMLQNPEVAASVPFDVHFTQTPLPLEQYDVGEHTLHLSLNDVPFTVLLVVSDTTPPVGLSVDVETIIGGEVFAGDFVTELYDASGIYSVEFEEAPDTFNASQPEQTVRIVITDNNGNFETISSTLTLILNENPPVIDGVPEVIEVKIDTVIDYFNGVTAYDDFDRPLELNVNDNAVDTSTVGTYSAVVWAEDYSGNITEVEIIIHIISIDPAEFLKEIDDILSGILNNRMTQVDKAKAIHTWLLSRITNVNTSSSDSDSIIEVAYQALNIKRGNAFAHSALASVMLTQAGVPNMLIYRIESAAEPHRWVLINPDDKGWHHFDSFRTGILRHNSVSYMFTDKVAKEIMPTIKSHSNIADYYTYNPDLYPEIVKE